MTTNRESVLLSNFFNLGGTQQLAYSVINVFKANGYSIYIFTGRKSKFLPKNADCIYFLKYPYFSNSNRISIFANEILLRRELSKYKMDEYELAFNNQPNTFLFNASINYLHGPSLFESFMNQKGVVKNHFLYNIIRNTGIYRLYKNGLFLTHGNYTKEYSVKGFDLLNIRPRKIIVINTPVQYKLIDKVPKKDPNTVLTFGRIAPDKNLELISLIARKLPLKFIISGYVSNEHMEYLEKLKGKMPNNVTFILNPSETDKVNLYTRSNLYLHTKPEEHFGLTVAEALWFGCIPVVPKSGGAWEDIVMKGQYGYGYNNEEELLRIINDIRTDQINDEMFASRLRFSMDTFFKKFTEIISDINLSQQ
jgi:glycosyltransferase involved in cell wall biosynthesis